MKIGFCGTQSVGKSTLVKELSKLPQFKDYFISTERSGYLNSIGIPLNTDSTLKGQFIFGAERSSELFKDKLLTDRTIWDVCSFTLTAKSIKESSKLLFVKTLMNLKDEYDIVFYILPEGTNIEDNGVRETNLEFRELIDLTIQSLLEQYPPNKLVILKGPTEFRIKEVLKYIK